jgi:ribosomal protein L16 Arg81 hydroxylase
MNEDELLDHFAGLAMQSLMRTRHSAPDEDGRGMPYEVIAMCAYGMARQMLKERAQEIRERAFDGAV